MAPRRGAKASRIAPGVSPATLDSLTTRPAASRVSVSTPKRTSASYCLSASSRKETSFVASPTQTGRTPEASESSVPPWPTLSRRRTPARGACRAASRARTRRTTAKEVGPEGLSITSTPMRSPRPFGSGLFGAVVRDVAQQSVHLGLLLEDPVDLERQRGDGAQPQLLAQQPAQVAGGVVQTV